MKWTRVALIAGTVIVVDQGSKMMVSSHVQLNRGISFSLLGQFAPWVVVMILGGLVAVMAWTGRDFWQKHQLAAGFLLGGAFSNILDRIIFGGVRDWWFIPVLNVHNNIADWAIVIGIGILILKEGMTYVRSRNTV